MVKPEKRVLRSQEHTPDPQYDNRVGMRNADRKKVFYKLLANRDRRNRQGSARHWMVESDYWHLDVTVQENGNHILEKQAVYPLNIIRKLTLNILKLIEMRSKPFRLKKKRFAIGTNPEKHLELIMNL